MNHKRVLRLYRAEDLMVRRKRRKRLARGARQVKPVAVARNERWSMDFVHDALFNGRPFRSLTIVDDHSRECPWIEVDHSIGGARVVRVLDRLGETWGTPKTIVVDNGPEFAGRALDAWAHARGVALHFSRPGKPTDNCFIESFNGSFRDECLNENWFVSIGDARRRIENWRNDYNKVRPHSSLGQRSPSEYAWDCRAAGTVRNGRRVKEERKTEENSTTRNGS